MRDTSLELGLALKLAGDMRAPGIYLSVYGCLEQGATLSHETGLLIVALFCGCCFGGGGRDDISVANRVGLEKTDVPFLLLHRI